MPNILTHTIFLPLVGSAILLLIPREKLGAIKALGIALSVLTFIFSLFVYFQFDASLSGIEFAHKVLWIPALNVSYSVGVDGLSLLLVMLTTFLTPIAMLSSWNSVQKRLKEYTIMILLLETGMIGVFCATDLFLFYVFWEAMLIPMYFIIGIWGGDICFNGAMTSEIYTMFGSLLMLVAIIWLGYYASTLPGGQFTTDLGTLYSLGPQIPVAIQTWMFLAFTLSFAIKVPLFPFHTWLPAAHVEAPTAGSVLLASILLKMGTYGFLRFSLPMAPEATQFFTPYIL